MLTFSKSKLDDELKKIPDIFVVNGNPESVILSNISKFHKRRPS